jgi:hypothetical protein
VNQEFVLGKLGDLMGWDEERAHIEFAWLRLMSRLKYDGYQDFLAGMRFIESLTDWLQQFLPQRARPHRPGTPARGHHRLYHPGTPEQSARAAAGGAGLGAAYILLGLRYSPALAAHLFRGLLPMKESPTYQAILEEGRTEGAVAEARKVLRLQGDEAFGPPDARTAAAIERQSDLAQLEGLLKRVRIAGSWQELLGPPAPGRRGGRRRPSP